MDAGSFVLDADGVRWAHDLGAENYNRIESLGMTALVEVHTEDEADRALEAWGVEPVVVEPLRGGSVNEHWRVDTTLGGRWVLRRYNSRHLPASTPYEHGVLAFLAQRDWPVSAEEEVRANPFAGLAALKKQS